jgi:hypothetical protein
MRRVEVNIQVVVEEYDDAGNLLSQRAGQSLSLAGLNSGALVRAWAQAGQAISEAVWPQPVERVQE